MSDPTSIHIEEHDIYGKKIGVFTAFLAILLSFFTINAHRAHTKTIEFQNETNNQWAHYQSKRIREYQLEMNMNLIQIMPVTSQNKAALIKSYAEKHDQYVKDLSAIKATADVTAQKNQLIQKKALYYDFAEGILEISLVMSSLYFISRKQLFPWLGVTFGLLGTAMGIYGLLL